MKGVRVRESLNISKMIGSFHQLVNFRNVSFELSLHNGQSASRVFHLWHL